MERVDLGPCRAIRHEGDESRVAVLLPGHFYPTQAPALWFAREAAMASLLAGAVADRDLPAVWLTPLLNEPAVLDGLARARRPTLLVGGSADPTWRPDALPADHSLELLGLPGREHTLEIPGDPVTSLAGFGQMTEEIMRFADRIYDTG